MVVLHDWAHEFLHYVVQLCNYDLSKIGNMNEMPIWVEMLGNYNIEETGIKSMNMMTTGNEKSRIMVMLSVLADGTKLPL